MSKWSAIPECPCQAEGHAQKRQTHIPTCSNRISNIFNTYSVYRYTVYSHLYTCSFQCISTLNYLFSSTVYSRSNACSWVQHLECPVSFKNSATGTPFISVTVPVQLLHYLIILSRSKWMIYSPMILYFYNFIYIWYFMQNTCTHGSWALCISIVCSFPTFPNTFSRWKGSSNQKQAAVYKSIGSRSLDW